MKGQTNRNILDQRLQRRLRHGMTDAGRVLWQRLRARQIDGHKFRRQHPYLDYVLDFVCLEQRLVVELDGGQHLASEADRIRDRRLGQAGYRVLRFWNNAVLGELEAVLEVIRQALAKAPHPHPGPPPEGEGANPLPPLQGEGGGREGEFAEHAPRPSSGPGMQAGARSARGDGVGVDLETETGAGPC